MTQRQIEVEKKFSVPPSFEETLSKEGATLISKKDFHDSYYDFIDNSLSIQDCWLRRRNEKWQMKHVPKKLRKPGVVDSYHELDKEDDILRAMEQYVAMDTKALANVETLIDKLKLQVFASFETRRTKYRLEGVCIDLDSAGFGYDIGEIEIMVGCEEDVPQAEMDLEKVAKKLGINWEASCHGKLEEYLRLYNPSLLTQLVEKEVLTRQDLLQVNKTTFPKTP